MPRVDRKASSLLVVAIVLGLAFVMAAGTSVAQGDGAGASDGSGNATAGTLPPLAKAKTSRTITIGAFDDPALCGGKAQCWDTTKLFAKPGEKVTLIADLRDAGTHNLKVDVAGAKYEPSEADGSKTTDESGAVVMATFDVPESFTKEIAFVCTLHLANMKGAIMPYADYSASIAGGGHEIEVPHLGVNFLAYWVGLIAFALLFIVYGVTFFLFKYNETPATTDHWDRTGAGAPEVRKRMPGGNALLLSLVLAIVVLAAILWLARR